MRCAACHRPIRKPALVLAGMTLGPICAEKVREAAALLDGPKHAQLARERRALSEAVRDEHTADLFAEVAL